MEHYKKCSSKYVEEIVSPNELRIVPSTRQNDVINTIVEMLNDECNRTSGVIVSGCGDDCTKVVTIVEQLKRKIMQTLTQSTSIRYNKIEDLWKADTEGLDNLKVTRHIPVLSIKLMASESVSFKTQNKSSRGKHGNTRSHHTHRSKNRTS